MLYELDIKDWQIEPPAEPEEPEEELDEYGQPVTVCPWEMEY